VVKIKNYTFRELAVEYLTYCQNQRNYRAKSIRIQQLVVEFGNFPLKNFTTQLLEQYQTHLLTTKREPLKGTDTPRGAVVGATVNRWRTSEAGLSMRRDRRDAISVWSNGGFTSFHVGYWAK